MIKERLADIIKLELDKLSEPLKTKVTLGVITSYGEGVAFVSNLAGGKFGDLVSLEKNENIIGLIVGIAYGVLEVIFFSQTKDIKEGDKVNLRNSLFLLPSDVNFLGKVIDPVLNVVEVFSLEKTTIGQKNDLLEKKTDDDIKLIFNLVINYN